MLRDYANTAQGQIHLRHQYNSDEGLPLICLHPAPYSGIYFETLAPLLSAPSEIIAPDYPGYGGSDTPDDLPTIESYAKAMLQMMDDFGIDQANLLGFHTGCLVALEMARQQAERIHKLIIIDAPYFTGDKRQEMYQAAAVARELEDDVQSLSESFEFNISRKLDHMSYERSFALFTEQLRPADRSHWAFHAAFTYDTEPAVQACSHAGLVIASKSMLHDATLRFAAEAANMSLIEKPDITRSVMEEGAESIAEEVNRYLS